MTTIRMGEFDRFLMATRQQILTGTTVIRTEWTMAEATMVAESKPDHYGSMIRGDVEQDGIK